MERSRILLLAIIAIVGGGVAAQAGPCTKQISQVEQRIRQAQLSSPPGGAIGPAVAGGAAATGER